MEKKERAEFTFGTSLVKPPSFAFGKSVSTLDTGGTKTTAAPEEKAEKSLALPVTTVFSGLQPKCDPPWRNVLWTEEPSSRDAPQARVLLLGPIQSGKSSFISSVQSAFNGRVTNRAMVGSCLNASFTKKLQSFIIHNQKGENRSELVLCDIMGLGDGVIEGLTLHDILSVIKGHVPEGHKFSPLQPVASDTVGYMKTPSLKDRIHCVAFVVDASKITSYPKGLGSTFRQLREHISSLGVHQVALVTHVDQVCRDTAKDVSNVYKSVSVRETINKAGDLLGMCTSYIVPVVNYSCELEVDVNTDVLLLSAVDHILQYVDLFFHDHGSNKSNASL